MRAVLLITVLAVGAFAANSQSILITPESTYHGATRSEKFLEKWTEDRGGLLHVFVKNDGGQVETITGLSLNGQDISAYPDVRWWRTWPQVLAPGVCGWVTIKAIGAPLEQGRAVDIEIKTASGARAKATIKCVTPVLRLGNVLPSPDGKTLYVYVRNAGSETIHLTKLYINEREHTIGEGHALELVGSADLAAGGLAILKQSFELPLPPLAPLAVRVAGTHAAGTVFVGAGMRLTEPRFAVGTWSSDLPKDPEALAYARTLDIDRVVTGSNWAVNAKMAEQYHIHTVNAIVERDPKAQNPAKIEEQKANPDIADWMVRDEPDLGGKPSHDMAEHTMNLWKNDADTPAFMNLTTTGAYNEYGNIPDVTCVDHYVMFAPNVLPWSGVSRTPVMEEAIDYTEYLKRNTEPLRMWSWTQLAATAWNRQPLIWGINYQFWAQVMCGSKGILWFKYGPGFENIYTSQIQAGQRLMTIFEQMRTLCFYGEALDNLQSANEKAVGRTLNSEDGVVAIVLNNNYEIGGVPLHPRYTINPLKSRVSVPVPAWVPVEQVVRLTEDGPEPIEHELTAGTMSFDVDLNETMGVYFIGKKDALPPGPISGFNAPLRNGKLLVLSWEAAQDNFGVRGYTVYHGGEKVTDVYAPVALLRNADAKSGSYAIEAFDAAGNRGPKSESVQVP